MVYAAVACRFVIGAVFVTSAATKLFGRSAFTGFTRSLRQLNLVPRRLVRVTAGVVILAEAVIALMMAVPYRASAVAGFGVAAALLTAFTAAIVISLRRGQRTPCRCFGTSSTPLGPQHVVRNGFLVGVAALGLVTSLAGGAGGPAGFGELATAAIAGLVVGALIIALDDIVELFSHRR